MPTERTIIFILWAGLTPVSGVTAWVLTIRRELRRRGLPVKVLIHRPVADVEAWSDADGVFCTSSELAALLQPLSPAVLIVMNKGHHLICGLTAGVLNREGGRFHVISVVHSDSHEEYYQWVTILQPWVDHFIGVSPTVRDRVCRILERNGSAKGLVSLLVYGVHCDASLDRGWSSRPLRLVYSGRLVQRQKRVFDFVRLVDELVTRDVEFKLTLFGKGPEQAALKERLADHLAAGTVCCAGHVAHDEMVRAWYEHDVFVNLSEYEGTSVAMLEAMAAGCVPVVTETSSGVRGVLEHGENGLFARVGDVAQLVRYLQEIGRSPGRLEAMGRRAHDMVRSQYAIGPHADAFLATVAQVAMVPPVSSADGSSDVLRRFIDGLEIETRSYAKARAAAAELQPPSSA